MEVKIVVCNKIVFYLKIDVIVWTSPASSSALSFILEEITILVAIRNESMNA